MVISPLEFTRADELCKAVPDGEQGVVFTCSSVHPVVKRRILDDRTIQIIDEDGIRAWCAITSTMSCRLNSVARVMYGDDRGKAVMVRSVNYESGMAVVAVVPDSKEMMLPIGCLEEIGPDEDAPIDTGSEITSRVPSGMVRVEDDFPIDPVDKLLNQAMEDEAAHVKDDFAASSEEYFGFLCDLANLAQDSFEKGLGLSVRAIHKTRVGLMKSIMPEMFDGPHPDIDILEGSQHVRYVEFKNGVYSTVNVLSFASDNSFKCECSHRLNETYRFTLCSHLVAAIIRLGFEEHRDWKFAKHRLRIFRKELNAFRVKNVIRVALALRDVLGDGSGQLLKEYLWSHMPDGDDEYEEDREGTNTASSTNFEKHIRNLLKNDSEMLELLKTLETDMSRLDEISLRRVVNTLYEH